MNAPISFKTTSQVYFYKALEIFNLFYRLLRYLENTFGHLRPLLRGWPLTLDIVEKISVFLITKC